MHFILKSVTYNLDHYHKIHRDPSDDTRILMDIRAGGTQEGNGREVLQFESESDCAEAFNMLNTALSAGVESFDYYALIDAMNERMSEEEHSPLLELGWGVIANAYGGNWDQAPQDWRDAANRFRNAYFHLEQDGG